MMMMMIYIFNFNMSKVKSLGAEKSVDHLGCTACTYLYY